MSRWALLSLGLLCACATPRPKGVYFVMVDRFENGDRSNDGDVDPDDPQAFHGGDLQGLIDRLDWIQSLGFDTVWVSPLFAMRTEKWHDYGAFHGYWTWDLERLEPRFGDEALLKKLRDALDARHMRLILDLVLNHVGPDAPLLQKHPDWFHHRGGVTDWNDPQQLVMNDVHGLPDLATENPETFRYLLDATRHWEQVAHPAGFRLDAVKHLPTQFWRMFNGQVDGIKLGELLEGDPGAIARTWQQGGFTSMFDFPLAFAIAEVFCRGASPARLGAVLTNDRRYPDASQLVTLVDNHDLPRLLSVCGGDVDKAKQALAFLFSVRGVPSITWGTEVGLDGDKEPFNRASMRFVDHPLKAHVTEWMKRRAQTPALDHGTTVITEADAGHLVFVRSADDGSAVSVRVEGGAVTVTPTGPIAAPAGTVTIHFEGEGRVVGSGPEFGDWDPARALPMPVDVQLPLGGVFELKRLRGDQWDEGANRVLFIAGPATVSW